MNTHKRCDASFCKNVAVMCRTINGKLMWLCEKHVRLWKNKM